MRARGSSDDVLQQLGCTETACGLLLPSDLTLEDWAAVGRALGRQQRTLQWRIGDWWNHPGHAYGDRIAIVQSVDWEDDGSPAFSTCVHAGRAARAFPEESRRRRPLLSFSHHLEVASLPPRMADELLDLCEETAAVTGKPLSVRALRKEINQRLERIPTRPFGASETMAVTLAPAPPPDTSRLVLIPVAAAPRPSCDTRRRGCRLTRPQRCSWRRLIRPSSFWGD
jgi:hypothetical protein